MNLQTVLNNETTQALVDRASNLPVEAVKIKTDEQFKEADDLVQEVSALLMEVDAHRKSFTRPMDDDKREIMEYFKTTCVNGLEKAKENLTRAIRIYQGEQELKAREAAAKEEEKRRKAAEKLDARAEQADEKGQHEKAEHLRQQAETQVPIVPTSDLPKSKGVRNNARWTFKITDESQIPPEYMQPNEKMIGDVVRSMKNKTNIPGVRAYDANSLEALSS